MVFRICDYWFHARIIYVLTWSSTDTLVCAPVKVTAAGNEAPGIKRRELGSKNALTPLLGCTLPHVIHNDEECERLTNELLRLDEREDLSPEEKELSELLTVLIEEYEERRYPLRKASPQQTLQHLMEARSLTQKDLWKLLGSQGITSEVFHGKRHQQSTRKETSVLLSRRCRAVHFSRFAKFPMGSRFSV
jgi:HTH-type transcriptional regulator/antitoxin HigA